MAGTEGRDIYYCTVRRVRGERRSGVCGDAILWMRQGPMGRTGNSDTHRREHLSVKKASRMEEHLARNERMAQAYQLVLDLRGFYELDHPSPKFSLQC
jgi:hypothetical protein